MIISRGRRYIFVHIPKTGGTAMALALEDRAMKDDILIGDTPKAKKRKARLKHLTPAGRLWKHSTLADIDGIVDRRELDEMLVFALVRNPWDRVVSYYHWLKAQSFDHRAVTLAKTHTFTDFLRQPQTQISLKSAPFGSYVRDVSGRELPTLFIRLEHLTQDLAPLETHLGFPLTLPHANRSERSAGFQSYYTEETRAIVSRICDADIARFGYRFE